MADLRFDAEADTRSHGLSIPTRSRFGARDRRSEDAPSPCPCTPSAAGTREGSFLKFCLNEIEILESQVRKMFGLD